MIVYQITAGLFKLILRIFVVVFINNVRDKTSFNNNTGEKGYEQL